MFRRGLIVCLALLALSRAAFGLQITEIMYHPPNDGEETAGLEWIELYNDSAIPTDLSEHFFTDGVQFSFPIDSILDGRSYLVLTNNLKLFRETYPRVENVIGEFEGRLENSGERLELAMASGGRLVSFRYNDGGSWSGHAAGAGYSLSLRRPIDDPSKVGNWTHSLLRGGTPGGDNFPPPIPVDTSILNAEDPQVLRLQRGWDGTAIAEFSDPPEAWHATDFDDSSWELVPGPVGFGQNDFVTVLEDMEDNYVSFALRTNLEITQEVYDDLELVILDIGYDDGVIVFLNGEEISRAAIPGDPGVTVPASETATGASEVTRNPLVVTIPKKQIRVGSNLLGLQVHNTRISSNDGGVLIGARYRKFLKTTPPPLPSVRFSEIGWTVGGGDGFIELLSDDIAAVDLSGFRLSANSDDLEGQAFDDGTVLGPGERLVIDAATLPFGLDMAPARLFLIDPSGEHVVDAAVLNPPRNMPDAAWSHARIPDVDGAFVVSLSPSPGAINTAPIEDRLVINEIHYHPIERSDELEFLELHNRSEETIDLSRVRVRSGYNFEFSDGDTLEAGGFILLARNPQALAENYDLDGVRLIGPAKDATPEQLESFGRLSNQGEAIEIEDAWGNTIDRVRYYDGGKWSALADGGGSSLELIDPDQDNSAHSAWSASDESAKSEWTEFKITGTYRSLPPSTMESEIQFYLLGDGEFLLDDVSIRQSASPDLELNSNPDFEKTTTPWRLTGNHVFSSRTEEEAHGGQASLHVVSTGSGDQKVNHIELDTRPSLRINQEATVTFWARWLRGVHKVHVCFYNNVLGQTFALPVPSTAGTPGRENQARADLREETGSTNSGPVISDVLHSPPVPDPGTQVTLRARVSDSNGLQNVEAVYRVIGAGQEWQRAEMFDDGAHGDGRSGDGLFAASFTAGAANTRYQFYVEASDTLDAFRTWPPESAPHAFIIDDSFTATPHSLLRYRLVMDDENGRELSRRLLHSDDLVSGTFIYEEEQVYYNVGLRYRGSPWNRPPTPRMFRMRLQNDQPLRGEQRRVNLSRYGDDQNEGVAYQLLRKMSRPWAPTPHSPHYEYIDINLNGQPHTPSHPMAEIQPIDINYIEKNFPDDSGGWNYKITGKIAFTDAGTHKGGSPQWSQLRWYGPSKEDIRFYYNPGIRKTDDNFEPLLDLFSVFDANQTSSEEFLPRLRETFNFESSFRVFAIRDLIADWDTLGIGNGQNAFFYYAPLEGRVHLLPWDMDHAFERAGQGLMAGADPGVGRMIRHPTLRRQYGRILLEAVEGPLDAQYVSRWIDGVHRITGPARTASPNGIRSFLDGRRRTANTILASAQAAEFSVEGRASIKNGAGRVVGTAPLTVDSLVPLQDGEPLADVAPTEWLAALGNRIPTEWEVPLEGRSDGEEIEIFAFNAAGEFLDSGSVTLVDTTGAPPPVIETVQPPFGNSDGGDIIELHGSGFLEGARVLFGRSESPTVTVVAPALIQCVSPGGRANRDSDIEVLNFDGQSVEVEDAIRFLSDATEFLRGDADGDGQIVLSDAVFSLEWLFREGREPPCLDAADADDNGSVNLNDPVRVLRFLFQGDVIPEPTKQPGPDLTNDSLGCAS